MTTTQEDQPDTTKAPISEQRESQPASTHKQPTIPPLSEQPASDQQEEDPATPTLTTESSLPEESEDAPTPEDSEASDAAEVQVTTTAPVASNPPSSILEGMTSLSMDCPTCNAPMTSLVVAGYRVHQCERCGYQKQVLMRDLRA